MTGLVTGNGVDIIDLGHYILDADILQNDIIETNHSDQ